MKLLVTTLTAFSFGLVSMYIYLGKSFSTVSQMAVENQISNDVRFIELIEEGKIDELKKKLIVHIDCNSAVYENNLDSIFWERTSFSNTILKKAKPYIGKASACSELRNSTL
ncbi:hypothetical protein [Pleionea litopenaei]|uniref:Uncharacterized protein n=1 Tax=Pleionea litopenaei TaxID=3070815 RepID=A0AA51RQ86_9GAMM|nr:hypothetical protein [Pleionea sp. HL-JVS1]WMS85532.1 hypothetical protein Q9312_09935 [Pleionea sp. HL-JVS1]